MQLSDNLSPSPYRCTGREHLVPSSPIINPHLYIYHYTHLHIPDSCIWCTSSVDGTLSHTPLTSPHFPPSHLMQLHSLSCIELGILLFIHVHVVEPLNEEERPFLLPLSGENVHYMFNIGIKSRIKVYYHYRYIYTWHTVKKAEGNGQE